MPRRIIIDTDPGQDDAVGLLLALASPELSVEAVTTVAGNVPLALTSLNARKVLELAGRPDIPVYAGAVRPMVRRLVTAEHVHGRTGLDGAVLPEPGFALQETHAVDALVERLDNAEPSSITLCMFGPLTNLALALIKRPSITTAIAEVVLMGGAGFEGGNITPSAEFNIYVDPEAADVVLSAGLPVTMAPLDVTHEVLTTPERLARFRALGNRAGAVIADLLGFSEGFDRRKYGWAGAPLHDPNVIVYLLDPALYTSRHVNVAIELASPLTRGMTVVDYWHVTDRPRNVTYLRHARAEGIYELLFERLARLP